MFLKVFFLHHLLLNLVKNVDERGRNIVRTHITEQIFFHLYPFCVPFCYLVTQSH